MAQWIKGIEITKKIKAWVALAYNPRAPELGRQKHENPWGSLIKLSRPKRDPSQKTRWMAPKTQHPRLTSAIPMHMHAYTHTVHTCVHTQRYTYSFKIMTNTSKGSNKSSI